MIHKPKFIKNIVDTLVSTKGSGLVIFFITLFTLTALLSSRYYLFQDVIKDGMSKKDVYAAKTIHIIDTEKTEKRRHELANKVESIYRPAQDSINDYERKNLLELLSSIKQIRESDEPSVDKNEEIKKVLGLTDANYLENASVVYLYKSSDKNFSRINAETLNTLDKVLERGISENEIINEGNQIIDQNIDSNLSRIQHHSITLLIKKIILPNMVIDELATEIAKNNAMSAVRPYEVTFNKGDKIVSKNDLVTKLQRDALKALGYNVSQLDIFGIFGIMCLVGICLYTVAYYIVNFEKQYLTPSYLCLMSLLAISVVLFAVFLPSNIPVYIIPIPAVAILLTIFINSRIALLTTLLIIIMAGVSLQYKVEAVTVFVIGAMVATFTTSMVNYYRRMDLVKTGFDVALIQVLVILSTYLFQTGFEPATLNIALTDVSLGFISGIISGIIVLGTLPLIESAFGIITPYGLVELADHNQDLLRRLQFEAPGTYHHSLMVSNLTEAAAEAVNANPVLARVGSFYHDIGKLKRPLFFVENQSYFGIENPHEKLNPRLSKMVVTAHPKDGLELAKEYKLPAVIHQFISQHHGDGLALYFYKQALETEGAENITEDQFRYTGPKPSSKETAILMLADAVESAVRAIKNPTPEEIDQTIDKIIKERLIDGQLSESPLTQKDLKQIASAFNRVLRGMQHHRIKYHENILEELGQRTGLGINIASTVNKTEKTVDLKAQNDQGKQENND